MQHVFQVDLRGMIDLLSEHLYSGPHVFVRELLQNATDAISARKLLEPGFQGRVSIEVIPGSGQTMPMLEFSDDGVGLTPEEVQEFLATIGRSSKRGSTDFIGQFGIGLLSCFVVSDEIELISHSARTSSSAPGVTWRGYANGQYALEDNPARLEVGSRVRLRAKEGREEWFTFERVRDLCVRFGGLLPFPIEVRQGSVTERINPLPAPWQRQFDTVQNRDAALRAFGREVLGADPFDVVPIRTDAGEIEGVAFVLPWTPHLGARGQHRVYVRSMLLSDDSDNLVPEWAFFVKCVLNADALRPNAARDALYEDDTLEQATRQIGDVLRAYLLGLADNNPNRLKQLIALHYFSIKALAVQDDDFFDLFHAWLPFQSSLGRVTLPEFLERHPQIQYAKDDALFQQAAQVLGARGQGVINAMYTFDEPLLERFARSNPHLEVKALEAKDLTTDFGVLNQDERREITVLKRVANEVLLGFGCEAEISRFAPRDLPALYVPFDAYFVREMRHTRANLGGLWGEVLDDMTADFTPRGLNAPNAELHLNFDAPLVRRLAALPDGPLLRRVIGTLYVQSLLHGHHPLGAGEMKLLSEGMMELIGFAMRDVDVQSRLN
jgi:molecular chaperone HtpG